ncbi:MAG: ATP-binding protein [Ignavibacteria bacterium]|nr:ATP-binding protein [Ignavibacteria bacterium]
MTQHTKHTDLTLDISSKTDLLVEVRTFVTDAARAFGFADDDVSNIELAVDEACTNIIKHAYQYNPAGRIRLAISSTAEQDQPRRFIITIHDDGRSFDASHYTLPDMTQYFQRPRRGGLGVVLMKKLMDEVEYSIAPGAPNAIRLVKYLLPLHPRSA